MEICTIKKITNAGLFILLLALPVMSYAQQDSLNKHSKIIFGVSANAYKGDLGKAYHQWTAAYHISFLPNYQKWLHGGLHASWGSVAGQEVPTNTFDAENAVATNEFFSTNFLSIHYALQYNLILSKSFMVYLSQGLGFMRFMPQDEFGNKLQDALSTRAANETYTNIAAILPTQIGVAYYFPNQFGLGLKAGWLNTTTDYIDNISLLGRKKGSDNIIQYHLMFHVPANF